MLKAILAPLQKGVMLQNPAAWKNLQNFIQLLAGALPLVVFFVPAAQVLIDTGMLAKAYAGVGAISIYLTTATTDKIGF
jgi:hypothetical protein